MFDFRVKRTTRHLEHRLPGSRADRSARPDTPDRADRPGHGRPCRSTVRPYGHGRPAGETDGCAGPTRRPSRPSSHGSSRSSPRRRRPAGSIPRCAAAAGSSGRGSPGAPPGFRRCCADCSIGPRPPRRRGCSATSSWRGVFQTGPAMPAALPYLIRLTAEPEASVRSRLLELLLLVAEFSHSVDREGERAVQLFGSRPRPPRTRAVPGGLSLRPPGGGPGGVRSLRSRLPRSPRPRAVARPAAVPPTAPARA